MKSSITILVILFVSSSIHSQMVIGGKASYEKYFGPSLNGGTLHVFAERSFGAYDSFSLRAGVFCRLPMNHSENYSPAMGFNFFHDPFSEENLLPQQTMVRTTYNDVGLFAEFMYFFRKQAIENSFYVLIKAGGSFSIIKRRADTDDMQQYLASKDLDKSNQFSLCVGSGVGYQFYISKNSMLFSEILFVAPFVSMDGESFFGSASNNIASYPSLSLSANIGFKYFLFN